MKKKNISFTGTSVSLIEAQAQAVLPNIVRDVLNGPAAILPPDKVSALVEHPARKLFDMPVDHELAARLAEDIREHGLLTPILVLGNQVVDGLKCLKACQTAGVEPRFCFLPPLAEPFVEQIFVVRNFSRQHLNKSQLAMIGAQICLGLEDEARQRSLDALKGKKFHGKGKSAKRAAQLVGVSPAQIKKAKALLGSPQATKVWSGQWSVHQATRDQRTTAAKQRAIELAAIHPPKPGDIQILHGNFAKALTKVAENSVNLILTDPPYDAGSLPLWGQLAELSARILKPGGLFVAMSGKKFLPQVFAQMAHAGLVWGWEWTVMFNGPTASFNSHGFVSRSRPLLVYFKTDSTAKKPHRRLGAGGEDVIETNGTDTTFHPYGQKVELYEELLKRFTKPGDLVVDPFGGGGTIARACANLDRRCVTSEINRHYFTAIHQRIFGREWEC